MSHNLNSLKVLYRGITYWSIIGAIKGDTRNLPGDPWDLVTTYNWAYNPTYNWGNPHKPIEGDYK